MHHEILSKEEVGVGTSTSPRDLFASRLLPSPASSRDWKPITRAYLLGSNKSQRALRKKRSRAAQLPMQNSHPISGCWESQRPQDPPCLQPSSLELLGLEYHAERPCCPCGPLATPSSTGFWCQFYKKFAAVPNVLQNYCALYEWSEKCLGR